MGILKLEAALKDYLWGGRRLVEEYNKKSDLPKVAESWEMSNHKDGSSTIVNGEYKGKSFKEYIEKEGKEVWGEHCKGYDNFPVMIKYIDAKDNLSIQVHPQDEYALKYENEFGKNEFWYILDCEPGAFLYYGVKEEMTKEEFRERIENGTICDYLNRVHVKKGDCFFIEAGTIHAIGAGIVIAEIQQCSNSTYRVYDFGRVGVDGKPRELHIDKAVDVTNLVPGNKNGEADGELIKEEGYSSLLLTDNKYFKCIKYDVHGAVELEATKESFNSVIIIEGNGTLTSSTESFKIRKGDSFFIPAGYGNYNISGNVKAIITRL